MTRDDHPATCDWRRRCGRCTVDAATARSRIQPKRGTVPKAALRYRDHPLGEKSCTTCAQVLPGATLSQEHHCRVVAAVVQPAGYYMAWQDRNPSNSS